jgi:hypothetical protein
MDMWFSLAESDRSRRAAIALFVAATFGLAAILSLPVARLIPFPFGLPPVAQDLSPPELVRPPTVLDWPTGGHPGTLERLRAAQAAQSSPVEPAVTVTRDRPDRSGTDKKQHEDRVPVVSDPEPLEGGVIHTDKVPRPPPNQQISQDKYRVAEEPHEELAKGEYGR